MSVSILRTYLSPCLETLIFSVQSMIKQFLELYTLDSPRWDNISSLGESFGWTDMITHSTSEYLESRGVTRRYSRELVEAATRVNYGQVGHDTCFTERRSQ
jgi:hypothetical protein